MIGAPLPSSGHVFRRHPSGSDCVSVRTPIMHAQTPSVPPRGVSRSRNGYLVFVHPWTKSCSRVFGRSPCRSIQRCYHSPAHLPSVRLVD